MEMRKGTPRVSTPEKREATVMETPSALLPKKPKKPVKPSKPKPSVPKKKPPVKPKVKPTTPKKKPIKPKKRPIKKKAEETTAGLDDVITIKKSTVYRFDG
jgi:hypothetical protein